jgi:hypothetical protein
MGKCEIISRLSAVVENIWETLMIDIPEEMNNLEAAFELVADRIEETDSMTYVAMHKLTIAERIECIKGTLSWGYGLA